MLDLKNIYRDPGTRFSAGQLGIVLSGAFEKSQTIEAAATEPVVLMTSTALATSMALAGFKTNSGYSMLANSALLIGTSAFLLTTAPMSTPLLATTTMLLGFGIGNGVKALEMFRGNKRLPVINSELFVSFGAVAVAFLMGGQTAAAIAGGFAISAMGFAFKAQQKKAAEADLNTLAARSSFIGINIVSLIAALNNADNITDPETIAAICGNLALLGGNIRLYHLTKTSLHEKLGRKASLKDYVIGLQPS